MKLLCVCDLHGEDACLGYLREALARVKPDAILIAGDLTAPGPESFGNDLLESLEGKKVFAVHGNMDNERVIRLLGERGVSIHGRITKFKGCSIAGIGGANPTPFHTPTEYSEGEITRILAGIGRVDVFVSHFPPFNTNADLVAGGAHAGSKALRDWILSVKPRVVVCGHIHENSGIESLGETKIVKLAPLMKKSFAVVEWPSLETRLE
ncbi:MAG: metallophosphoesterase [Candidatus Micrarchaeia archaeon]